MKGNLYVFSLLFVVVSFGMGIGFGFALSQNPPNYFAWFLLIPPALVVYAMGVAIKKEIVEPLTQLPKG